MNKDKLVFFIIFLFSIIDGFGQKRTPDITDTSFLKNTTYKKLNKYISYHIIKEGTYSTNPKLTYAFKIFDIYSYLDHRYKTFKDSKEEYGRANSVADILKSNRFANREGFEGIFKINSKMAFVWKPSILRNINIFPKKVDEGSIHLLMKKLNKVFFVSGITLDSMKLDLLDLMDHRKKRTVFIKVKVKSKYRNIDSLSALSRRLKKWPGVEDVVYVQLFTGIYEQENFFEIRSGLNIMPKKDTVKKSKDPFKDFVDSLKKK